MDEKEILVFRLDEREYGIEVSDLQGIEEIREITTVAKAPQYIKGIVNIRDEVYPVLDLRKKLGMTTNESTHEMKLLIMHTNAGHIACLVDEVCDIKIASGTDIQKFPRMLCVDDTKYIDCVIREGEKLIILLDSNHLFGEKEANQIGKMKGDKE